MKHFMLFFLIAILLLGCFATACQPTPKPSETKGLATYDPNFSDIPSTYKGQEELSDGILLSVNADVILPETALCTAKIERYAFDIPLIKKVANVLFDDAPVYLNEETQQELLRYIATVKLQIEAARDILTEADIVFSQQILSNMEAALPAAPDMEEPATLENIFSYDNGFVEIEAGREAKASFQALSNAPRNIIFYYNLGFKKHLLEDIPPLTLSEEGALEQAWDILGQLGLSGEFLVVQTGIHIINHTFVDAMLEEHGYAFPSRHERRYVIFMRKIGSAKQVYSEQIQQGAVMAEFDSAVFWELIEMQFDDNGLVGFNWNEPGNVVDVDENVQVITIDSAYQAFVDHLRVSQNKYTYAPFNIDSSKITVVIDRIELGMSCMVGKNGTIEALPVWEFFGEVEYVNDRGDTLFVDFDGQKLTQNTRGCNSICTINALSGTRIDRGLGY